MTPDRLFLLLRLLEQSPTTTASTLASQLGVSVRTLRRDLQWLSEAGFPVLTRPGKYGGVTWVPGSFYDLSRLSPQELVREWEQHGDLRVQLRLAPSQVERAHRLLGSRLVPPSDVSEQPIGDGASEWVRLDYRYRDLEDIRGLLPFGPDLLIISPPEAKQRLRELAEQTVALYRD
ncbi:transcriptional regulator [Nesterenkonia sp. MY13]|uniref:Transcriptional regulator n=1 Tax=Nesterenkonia sedimenti TaxID=1463632 RepID=A0A7X8YDW1_9MICC|nr:transcriptional regulator [Nesterenkonia sedimenti]NLS10133.1 transcriptional regulator [Nesterenkonia sedimenti]